MSLNTPAEIKNIIEVPVGLTDGQIQSAADDANLFIVEDLAGKGLTPARLKAIEKYLAAHFIILLTERGGLTSSKTGDSQDMYTNLALLRGTGETGLQLTRFGQQALLFDTSGTLKKLNKASLSAKFGVIGDAQDNGLGCGTGVIIGCP